MRWSPGPALNLMAVKPAPLPMILDFLKLIFRALVQPDSARFKGWTGETVTRRAFLGKLDPAVYRCYHDLYLPRPDGKGTTQLDHVVVSEFGLFVIETKNLSGWIFGRAEDASWTQQVYRKRQRFQNPLHQKKLHVRALQKYLALPASVFFPVVWMAGDAVFKTPVPPGVLTSGLAEPITSHNWSELSASEVSRVNTVLGILDRSLQRKEVGRLHNAQRRGP